MFYSIVKGFFSIVLFLFYRVKVEGIQNIPDSRGAVLCANHTSNLDPILISCSVKRKISYMAKGELFDIPVLRKALKALGAFPVRRGKADVHSIKSALDLLQEGNLVGIFPEGTRVKKGMEVKVKHGAGLIALKSDSPIVPIAIVGSYVPFSKVKMIIGQPYKLDVKDDEKLSTNELREISETIMHKIRSLIDIA